LENIRILTWGVEPQPTATSHKNFGHQTKEQKPTTISCKNHSKFNNKTKQNKMVTTNSVLKSVSTNLSTDAESQQTEDNSLVSPNGLASMLLCLAASLVATSVTSSIFREQYFEDSQYGIYVGERNSDGHRHGTGTFTWTSGAQAGDVYEGNWVANKMHGKGYVHNHKNGFMYFGEFSHDKFCGSGSLNLPFGKYSGDFREGQMHGYGEMKYKNGQIYTGDWREGRMCGRGMFQFANGDQYDGEFARNQQHGEGVYSYSNGDVFQGHYRDGCIEGHGTITYSDGVMVEGEWHNGQLDGPGTCVYANGDVYKGTWSASRKVGQVVFEPANALNAVYFGYWHSDELILSPGTVDDGSGHSSQAPSPMPLTM
jgi:hypothetical protein